MISPVVNARPSTSCASCDYELKERGVVVAGGEAGDVVAVHQVLAVAVEREDVREITEILL